MTITRNTDGFSTFNASDPLGNFNFLDPINYPYFMEHFLAYDIGQAAGNPYTFTATNCTDTIVGPTGVLTLTLGGADNDLGQIQLTETPWQTNSKRFWFDCKIKWTLNAVANNELFVGLASEQTGANFFAADGLSLTADDMLGFYKLDAESSMTAIMREADAGSTDAGVLTPVSGTWYRLSIYYDGGKATFYVDGAQVAQLNGNDTTSVITPTLYIKAGEAQANVLSCDHIFVGAQV
jgi:hypothetical protein